ncbi:hypothetical protein GPY51_10905 [Photorhabdus laumondii subsp. laumondii]|uniref:Uncharacterized protein n=2 Tax=Photorhabdus TaxID=29487 RepID=A0A6L9JKL5_PHOLM|nr:MULTISPECIES: hypothetical protein [Photorhabdus]KER01092.1 hypothetical protein MEG1DRAFT_04302 [Photorhabdus temperata subsp. temperata Meg1]MCC8384616.1 hypothetical protein [Photorhabdus laumondii]MCC8413338.1 hypothetical protein [Photorhabdus laumondii]MCC8421970.1 hypothetical protein [Photorhabdus thracensis]NDK95004.1 hypothetical protein [Photorhabdus laumondii subsp. laumondii]
MELTAEHQRYLTCIAQDMIADFKNMNELIEIVKGGGELYTDIFNAYSKLFFERQKDMCELALTSMSKSSNIVPLAVLKYMQDNKLVPEE